MQPKVLVQTILFRKLLVPLIHFFAGNFVTDAMVWAYRNQAGDPVSLALINSGGIKGFIDQGNITMENLLISFPFRNTFDVVLIKGLFLRQAFEHSVASMESDGRNEAGRFLQENIFTVIRSEWVQ